MSDSDDNRPSRKWIKRKVKRRYLRQDSSSENDLENSNPIDDNTDTFITSDHQ